MDLANYLISILISLFTGIFGFLFAYKLFDWLMPRLSQNQPSQSLAAVRLGPAKHQ